MDLRVDPARHQQSQRTRIFVRATLDGKWGSYDIAELDADSLRTWLRSRGGANEWAESTVLLLLGHNPAAEAEQPWQIWIDP